MSGAASSAGLETPGALLAARYHEDPALSAEDIACSAGYRLLFEAVGFELHAGEWLQLTGPNGSGKTTLLRAIAGLVRPARGTIRWHGIPTHGGIPSLAREHALSGTHRWLERVFEHPGQPGPSGPTGPGPGRKGRRSFCNRP